MSRQPPKIEGRVTLEPELLAALDEGIDSEVGGKDYSWEEVLTNIRQVRRPRLSGQDV